MVVGGGYHGYLSKEEKFKTLSIKYMSIHLQKELHLNTY